MDPERREAGLFVFPRWANAIRPHLTAAALLTPVYLAVLIYLAFAPGTSSEGYAPEQPVPYSHRLHAGELGLDCRYCHAGVETGAFATLPPTATCMNCHASVRADSELLAPIRDSYASGLPVAWVRVHDLPDYAYFDHSAHVSRGVGCESCHGRIDKMDVVTQAAGLNMAWCLACHRQPEPHLRPPAEVTTMGYVPSGDAFEIGSRLRAERNIDPPTDCSTCHR